jgi:hypothetical protein
MLYREIIAVCSQIHTKPINTLCGQNVELLNVKLCGTYSDHWAVNTKVNAVIDRTRKVCRLQSAQPHSNHTPLY